MLQFIRTLSDEYLLRQACFDKLSEPSSLLQETSAGKGPATAQENALMGLSCGGGASCQRTHQHALESSQHGFLAGARPVSSALLFSLLQLRMQSRQ